MGKRIDFGRYTYLIQVRDKHDNTLYIELSKDGSYWSVNSGGIFRKGYSDKKETVSDIELQKPDSAISGDSLRSTNGKVGTTNAEPNDKPTVSFDKGTNKSETLQEEKGKGEKGTQETPIDKINEHRASEGLEEVSEEEVALRDALNEQLKNSGIDVVTDVEDGERVLAMAEDNDVKENKVYHGCGADFDKFDHSHIGEGEGAQAFGWGTYLTEVKGIGEGYARKMAKYPQKRALKEAMREESIYEKSLISAKEELSDSKKYAEAKKQEYENLKAQAE